MAYLTFTWRNGPRSPAREVEDVEELKHANLDETTIGLAFKSYRFDEDSIVRAVIDLFQRASQKGCVLGLAIDWCTGRVDEILQAASTFGIFNEIYVEGHSSNISHHGFSSISAVMTSNNHLANISLSEMEMTRQQAAALGAGLITSNSQNHFKELEIYDVTFADGAITELASGLKQNSSLCLLNLDECYIGDVELAVLIGALESHPSLKELSLPGNGGHKHALAALGKMLSSSKCQLEGLNFSKQDHYGDGLTGYLWPLADGLRWNQSLTRLNLSSCQLLDNDIDDLGKILATCKLEKLDLSGNRSITPRGFVSCTQNFPKSLKSFDFSRARHLRKDIRKHEEAVCHTLKLFEEHPQLWDDGLNWEDSKLPIHQKIQHFKDLNRCGRILLVAHNGRPIPLSVWPVVLARANTVLSGDYKEERTHTAIFHLFRGLIALLRRTSHRDSSQGTCVGTGASERLPTSSKRRPAEMIDVASAKKGRSSQK
jgi:hypothetical protein